MKPVVYSVSKQRLVPISGYKVTKHFAVTPAVDMDTRPIRGMWRVTNIKTGAAGLYTTRNRRVAEIGCRVLEALPVEWREVRGHEHEGVSFCGSGAEQLRNVAPVMKKWNTALMMEMWRKD